MSIFLTIAFTCVILCLGFLAASRVATDPYTSIASTYDVIFGWGVLVSWVLALVFFIISIWV
jgi:hypothetical protein